MAAGAIPPPLFFERRRPIEHLGSGHGILRGIRTNTSSVDHAVEPPARLLMISSERSPPKDI